MLLVRVFTACAGKMALQHKGQTFAITTKSALDEQGLQAHEFLNVRGDTSQLINVRGDGRGEFVTNASTSQDSGEFAVTNHVVTASQADYLAATAITW